LPPDERYWLITGPPGIGKSTIVSKVVFNLRSTGCIIGGCITKERREKKERVGFDIEDLLSGRRGELASTSGHLGPTVGRYRVNLQGLSEVGARALNDAVARAELVVIDEVGPMELTSPEFRRALTSCIRSGKPIFAVVHEKMNDPLIEELKKTSGNGVISVSLQNRDSLHSDLTTRIQTSLTRMADIAS
jgi:nucleoside-triphosphatase